MDGGRDLDGKAELVVMGSLMGEDRHNSDYLASDDAPLKASCEQSD